MALLPYRVDICLPSNVFVASRNRGMPIIYRFNASMDTFLPRELDPISTQAIPAALEPPIHVSMHQWMAVFDAKGNDLFLGDASGNLYLVHEASVRCVGFARSTQGFSFKDLFVHPFGKYDPACCR
jgi:hypothetical protein